jgi:hypothetical protein
MSIAYTDDHDDKGATIRTRTTITPENYPREVCREQPYVPLCPTSEGGANFINVGVKGVRYRYVIVDVGGETVLIDVAAPADKFDALLPKAQKVLDNVE